MNHRRTVVPTLGLSNLGRDFVFRGKRLIFCHLRLIARTLREEFSDTAGYKVHQPLKGGGRCHELGATFEEDVCAGSAECPL